MKTRTKLMVATQASKQFTKVAPYLYRTEAGQYFGRIRHKGRLHRKSLDTGDFQTAKRNLKEFQTEVQTRSESAPDMLFQDFTKQWLESIKPHLKPSTFRRRESCVNMLMPFFKGLKLIVAEGIHLFHPVLSCQQALRKAKKGSRVNRRNAIVNSPVVEHGYVVNLNRNYPFWKQFPGLVWSNAHAGDSVMIMAALTRPRREQLEAIAEEFGFDRILVEWKVLQEEGLKPIHLEIVGEMLNEMAERMSHASGGHRSSLAGSPSPA